MKLLRWSFAGLVALFITARALAGLDVQPDMSNYATKVEVAATARSMYSSTCQVAVTTSTPTSVFCPVGTDSTSVSKRTYPANSLIVGRSFFLIGGGTYTVPTGNLNTADVFIKVGSATAMSITTPAAPVGSGAGVDFHAVCTVRTSTTINCQGVFSFVVAGATGAPVPFSQTNSFDPTVANLVDVLGDWNTGAGALSTHNCTVTQAALISLN